MSSHSARSERQDAAIEQSTNVARLQPRVVMDATPAVASVLARHDSSVQDAARAQAREAIAEAEATAVVRLDTPKQRYSAWVRLQARRHAGEQIADRDAAWINSYEGSAEFEAWHSLHEGSDPLAEAAG